MSTHGAQTNRETKQVVFLGILTFMTISAAAMLHVNQPEFILNRFDGIAEFEYSMFDSVLYFSYLVVGLLTGALSDRLGRRRQFVILGAFGSALFYWLMTTTLNYPILLIYRFLQGSFTVMAWQMFMTLVLDSSGSFSRGRSIGLFGTFLALAMGAGPVLGGVIADLGVFMPYYAASILSCIVLVSSILGLSDPPVIRQRPDLSDSLSIVKRSPKLIIPGVFNLIDRLHIGFILTALPLFLSAVLDLSESLRGMALGIFALPFILLQYPMGKLSDKYGRYAQLIAGSFGFGIVLSVFGYLGSYGFMAVLLTLAVMGFFNGVTAPPSMALVGDISEPEDTAMAMGFFNFMGNVGITVGPLIFGYMVFLTDFIVAFLTAGVLELVALFLNVVVIKVHFGEDLLS
jgi:MFS family permease